MQDIKKLLSRNIVAHVLSLVTLLITTKLYSTSDFGNFALFFTIFFIAGQVLSLRLDAAIMVEANKTKIETIYNVGIIIAIVFSVVIICVLVLLVGFAFILFSKFLFVSLAVICSLCYNFIVMNVSMMNKSGNFRKMGNIKILQNTLIAFFTIGFGFVHIENGLIAGNTVALLLMSIVLLFSQKSSLIAGNVKKIKQTLIEHKTFPLYSVPLILLNTLTINIFIFYIHAYYSKDLVGLYSHASKTVNFPLFIISLSVAPVFFRNITNSVSKWETTKNYYIVSLITAFCILSPLLIWHNELFRLVYGIEWESAGTIAYLLIPQTIFSFASTNVSNIFPAIKKNSQLLVWQLGYFIITLTTILVLKDVGIHTLILVYSLLSSILYFGLFLYIRYVLKNENL